jgi:hypothetical protein
MVDREIRAVTVLEGLWGKQGYSILVEYEDGTSTNVFVGTREAAHKAAREAVEIGEAYVRKLVEEAALEPLEPGQRGVGATP